MIGASSWSYVLDTKTLRNGRHSIQVRAFDGANYSDAAQLDLSVNNAAPATSLGPSNMLLIGLVAVVIIAVIAGVVLMRRGKAKGTSARAPSAPPEAQPAAVQQVQPPQQQAAADQYQPQAAMQPPVAQQYQPGAPAQPYAPEGVQFRPQQIPPPPGQQ